MHLPLEDHARNEIFRLLNLFLQGLQDYAIRRLAVLIAPGEAAVWVKAWVLAEGGKA